VTGFWFLDAPAGRRLDPRLIDFLEDGPPPVCVGFGSMNAGDAEAATTMVTEALARTGQRGILLTGWGGLAAGWTSDRILVIEAAPHDWLFPRVAAVVHHGGAGTTAAVLRAGIPSIAVPFMADQPFWAQRVFALGAGPRPIPRHRLSVERLAQALRLAGQPAVRTRALALSQQIRAEDGVGRAVALFEDHWQSQRQRRTSASGRISGRALARRGRVSRIEARFRADSVDRSLSAV
jgi:UDP:flavonoid glycosyltransferase YjiC (YdhE family)